MNQRDMINRVKKLNGELANELIKLIKLVFQIQIMAKQM